MTTRRVPYAHNIEGVANASPDPTAEDPFQTAGLEVVLDEPEIQAADPPQKEAKPDPVVEIADPAPEPAPVKPSADDEAYRLLKSQLDRERQAREAAHKRAQDLEAQHLSTREQLRQEQERQAAMARENLEAQEIAIDNAISYAESQAAQAQREINRGLSEGDYEASTAAYRLLAKAENDLARLKEGKGAIEVQKKTPVTRQDPPAQTQTQQPQTLYDQIEAYITQPAHSLRAQQYMRDHYDDLFRDFDKGAQRVSKLVGGHWLAKSDGVVENSDAYFDFLDKHMGYKGDPTPQQAPAQQPPAAKRVPPSAPVSRPAANDSSSPTKITLTRAEVEFCKESGVKPADYARNKLTAMKGANDPNYNGPRFSNDR